MMMPTMENMATMAALVVERVLKTERRAMVQHYQPFAVQDEMLMDAPEEIVRTIENDRVLNGASDNAEERAEDSLDYEPDEDNNDVKTNRFTFVLMRCLINLFRQTEVPRDWRRGRDVSCQLHIMPRLEKQELKPCPLVH